MDIHSYEYTDALSSFTYSLEDGVNCNYHFVVSSIGTELHLFTSYSHLDTNYNTFNWFQADLYYNR